MNNKLKQLREKRGLSQAEIAQEIGISRQMYNKYERGDTEPSLSAIKSLCTLYDISYEEMLGDSKIKSKVSYDSLHASYDRAVASPAAAYGTENYYTQILQLLPKLLLSEKSRLLTTIADSIAKEVEGRKSQPMKVNQKDVYFPTEEEFHAALERSLQYANEINFTTRGIKWTREEMHER